GQGARPSFRDGSRSSLLPAEPGDSRWQPREPLNDIAISYNEHPSTTSRRRPARTRSNPDHTARTESVGSPEGIHHHLEHRLEIASTAFPICRTYGLGSEIDFVAPSVDDRVTIEVIDELDDALLQL